MVLRIEAEIPAEHSPECKPKRPMERREPAARRLNPAVCERCRRLAALIEAANRHAYSKEEEAAA